MPGVFYAWSTFGNSLWLAGPAGEPVQAANPREAFAHAARAGASVLRFCCVGENIRALVVAMSGEPVGVPVQGCAMIPCLRGIPAMAAVRQLRALDTSVTQRPRWLPLHPDVDFVPYALREALQAPVDMAKARRLLVYHPAWAAASFVPAVDVDALIELLAAVTDIRLFQHPQRPGRLSRLFAFCGVWPANAEAAVAGADSGDRNFDRFCAVSRAWLGFPPALISKIELGDLGPRDFLRRIFATAPSTAGGLLRGTKAFLRLLAEMWTRDRQSQTGGSPLIGFDPAAGFTAVESEAFVLHVAQLARERGKAPRFAV